MTNKITNKFELFLNKFDENAWLAAIEKLLPAIHEVDKNATRIWFRFFPLELFRFLESAEDRAKAAQKFVMQGDYELKNQIDSSHNFLYGHRFWKTVKEEITARNESFNDENADLTDEIKQIAKTVADKLKVDSSLVVGIVAVGLMTLVQVGLENFKNAKGEISTPRGLLKKSPEQILAERAKDDSQGIFGFLKTVDKKFTAHWQDSRNNGSFPIKSDADIATASALDQSQNWKEKDERCWEGVVPVECRSAACGTCWVGVLGGEEKLSEVQRLERKQMKIFGYNQPDDEKPFLRLACQSKISGNVTFVIPPWNGVFGKKIYGVEESKLEPVTTSAKKLREQISEATNSSN